MLSWRVTHHCVVEDLKNITDITVYSEAFSSEFIENLEEMLQLLIVVCLACYPQRKSYIHRKKFWTFIFTLYRFRRVRALVDWPIRRLRPSFTTMDFLCLSVLWTPCRGWLRCAPSLRPSCPCPSTLALPLFLIWVFDAPLEPKTGGDSYGILSLTKN